MLLLDGIWDAYLHVKSKVLGARGARHSSLSVQQLEPFCIDLMVLPVRTPGSAEFNVFVEICHLLSQCRSLSSSFLSSTPIHSAPSVPALVPPPTNQVARGLQHLVDFVVECHALLTDLSARPEGPRLTPIQRFCLVNTDKFFPLREHARGRLSVTSLSGPFHPSNINLPGALASVFIWRGITFACPVSLEHPTYFPTLASFQALVQQCSSSPDARLSDPMYICDKKAYGRYLPDRSPDLAQVYFDAEPHFRDVFRKHEGPVPWKTFIHETQVRVQQKKVLPIIGDLMGSLLASDFSYSGLVAPPTVDEMAVVVSKLKAGAMDGLERCNLIVGTPDLESVQAAFKLAYAHLEAHLDPAVRQYICFDPIMVEHLLCKVKRFDNWQKQHK